jgi:hypothetical protein
MDGVSGKPAQAIVIIHLKQVLELAAASLKQMAYNARAVPRSH